MQSGALLEFNESKNSQNNQQSQSHHNQSKDQPCREVVNKVEAPAITKLDFNRAGEGMMLRPFKKWLLDDQVSEILVNRPHQVYIDKHGKMTAYDVPELSERHLDTLFKVIAKLNQKVINEMEPLFYGSLSDGTRVTLVYPDTSQEFSLSFRRKVVRDFKRDDYLNQGFYRKTKILRDLYDTKALLNKEDMDLVRKYQRLADLEDEHEKSTQNHIDDFIFSAVKARKNIVLSGGTSSGKTTFLNMLIEQIDAKDRIITLEDTRELEVKQDNRVSMISNVSRNDGKKENTITMQALVKACLRLRPDRIIMGEIRGAEIMNFCSAAKTGHSGSITTVHADDPLSAFQQMATYYKYNNVVMSDEDIMRTLTSVVDVIIQLNRTDEGRMVDVIWYKHGNLQLD